MGSEKAVVRDPRKGRLKLKDKRPALEHKKRFALTGGPGVGHAQSRRTTVAAIGTKGIQGNVRGRDVKTPVHPYRTL